MAWGLYTLSYISYKCKGRASLSIKKSHFKKNCHIKYFQYFLKYASVADKLKSAFKMQKYHLQDSNAKLRSQSRVISHLLHGVAQDSWKSIKCSNWTEKTSEQKVRANYWGMLNNYIFKHQRIANISSFWHERITKEHRLGGIKFCCMHFVLCMEKINCYTILGSDIIDN